MSHSSASTLSASSYLAPPSNASVSGFELVMFIRQPSCYSCNMNECVIMCLGLTVSVSSEVRIATGSMLRTVELGIYKISFLSC